MTTKFERYKDCKTIGDAINWLAETVNDIYILERALVKRCYPDSEKYRSVEIDGQLTQYSPGYIAEQQKFDAMMAEIKQWQKERQQ